MQQISTGIDQILNHSSSYKGKRIAQVTNNAALTSDGTTSRIALLKNGFDLVKLFSPEHGLNVMGADGCFQNNLVDGLTGLPVISLYSDHFTPTEKDLAGIDLVLFDIPDVGCRFYTYLWTMTYVMESCAMYNKPFIVLDRPNPIGGNLSLVEGPMLDEEHCSSFIGRWSIPIRHSCTLGELARYFTATKIRSLDLEIIPVLNWSRNQMADEAGWTFIPTSPAIQNLETALLYPGMGLLEGINVNEGRGTGKPFRICGAPWINGLRLKEAFMEKNCAGMSCQPIIYMPESGLYAEQVCQGLEFFVTDTNSFRPVAMGLILLQTIIELYPGQVHERLYNTIANPGGTAHLDRLLGVENALDKIRNGESILSSLSQLGAGPFRMDH